MLQRYSILGWAMPTKYNWRFQVSGNSALTPWHRIPHMKLQGMTNVECRLTNCGIASLSLFQIDRSTQKLTTGRIHYSMFDVGRSLVSHLIWLAVFLPRGDAHMKLHEIRCHFQKVSHRRARGERRGYLIFFSQRSLRTLRWTISFFFD